MMESFLLHSRLSPTGLHMRLSGSFHESAAQNLRQHLASQHKEGSRLFLDVRGLQELLPAQRQLFWQCLDGLALQSTQIYFKGEQGFALGRQGCKVLLIKRKACSCKGGCTTCACRQRAKQHKEGNA